ncbi:MAG: co-chaperone GroES [Thermoplasmataceae archaeon]
MPDPTERPAVQRRPLNVSGATERDRALPTDPVPVVSFRPLRDNVLIKRTKEQRVRPSGLIIPDQHSERVWSDEGLVVAVGPGVYKRRAGEVVPLDLKRGDLVIFERFAGQDIRLDGELFVVVPYPKIRATEERA